MKRVVITGATGLIGKKNSSKLVKRSEEVYVFTRNPDKARKLLPGAAAYDYWNSLMIPEIETG